MSLSLTQRAQNEASKNKVEPQLVLEIDGYSALFGTRNISKLIKIGDPGLLIGDSWKIGGLSLIVDQADVVSLDGGTSTSISQQLQPDKGPVSSVQSVQIALNDRSLIATKLITPGLEVADLLGTTATLWMGFVNTAFKEDYVIVFQGIVDDIDSASGKIILNLAHPDQLKRQTLFTPLNLAASAGFDAVVTTIPLVDATGVYAPKLGPTGAVDTSIKYYVKIEDEIIRYTGVAGNTLTGCTRGALATLAAAHAIPSGDVSIPTVTLVSLEGSMIDLALKLMLSGVNGFYAQALPVKRYIHPDGLTTVLNSIFFAGVDLNRDYGVVAGDYVTITGATNGANNCAAKKIQYTEVTNDGSFAVIEGVTFVGELATAAVVSFRSQYDTLGYGLGLLPKQVDIAEHIYWQDFILAGYQYLFMIDAEINGKDFTDKEIYLPVGAFSIPRKGRCSMGYHAGAVVRGDLKTISRANIKNPDQIKLRRTINRNFYNTVVYQFDKRLDGSYASGTINQDADSQARIAVGNKIFPIASAGMRRSLDGTGIANRISGRYLLRYRFAAEFIEAVGVLFNTGFTYEPGDVVLFDPTGLKISNTETGTRDKSPKLFIVMNTKIDLKSGDVTLSITDANFDGSERYGSVAPSSLVVGGTTTSIEIEDSFGAFFPGHESRKWEEYAGLPILVHSADWTYAHEVTFLKVDPGNHYKLLVDPATPLPTPPLSGYIIDVGTYPTSPIAAKNGKYKAVHAFLSASVAVTATGTTTTFDVGANISFFAAKDKVRIFNIDFSNDSGEVEVLSILGTVVTLKTALLFAPNISHTVENLKFADGGKTYRTF